MRARVIVAVVTTALGMVLYRQVPIDLAAQDSAALTGVVSSPGEAKMEGVVVTARRDGANFSVSVVSDAQGRYRFPQSHVEAGKYAVTMRATGYDLMDPGSVDVAAGKTATLNLTLQKTSDLSKQLSSREWAMSMPGPEAERDKVVFEAESCVYCHSLERIVKSKHTAEEFVPVITRMLRYYPDGTAAPSGTGRGRAVLKEKEGQEAADKSAVWFGDATKAGLGAYLATVNLSGGRTQIPFELKTLPRPKGQATRVIVTTWDLPRKDTVPHDSDVDSKGNLWYTDESAMFVGMLDPRTNKITEYPLPPVNKGDVPGARDIIVDKQDNVWFAMRVPGSKSPLVKFEPATQKLTIVDGTQGQFVAMQKDGSHVWLGYVRVDTKTAKVDGDFRHPANLPQGQNSVGYGFVVNSKGNPYGTDFIHSKIYGVDIAKNEGTFWPTERPGVLPRRGKIDAEDRFWYTEYAGDAMGMFDTKTAKMSEWKLPLKYTTPYTSTIPDVKGYVYASSNTSERMIRLNPKNGEVVEYPMPNGSGNFDTKKISFDPTAKKTVILFANTRNAQLMRVEPLD